MQPLQRHDLVETRHERFRLLNDTSVEEPLSHQTIQQPTTQQQSTMTHPRNTSIVTFILQFIRPIVIFTSHHKFHSFLFVHASANLQT